MKDRLKFDTNARGFKRAVIFLIFLSVVILGCGVYFLAGLMGHM